MQSNIRVAQKVNISTLYIYLERQTKPVYKVQIYLYLLS